MTGGVNPVHDVNDKQPYSSRKRCSKDENQVCHVKKYSSIENRNCDLLSISQRVSGSSPPAIVIFARTLGTRLSSDVRIMIDVINRGALFE